MSIQYLGSDKSIFDSQAQALVNPANCVGVMGKGLAYEFRQRYPTNYTAYRTAYLAGQLKIGQVLVHQLPPTAGITQWIINLPTKQHWRDSSQLEWISVGLISLEDALVELDIQSVALPALGCGLGGLDWVAVKAEIEFVFSSSHIEVEVYEPK